MKKLIKAVFLSISDKDLWVIGLSLASWVVDLKFLNLLAYVNKAIFRDIRKMKYKFRI